MQRFAVILLALLAALSTAPPVLAQEENPLANSVLLHGVVGWVMVGLALLLFFLFALWARRGPS